MPGLHVEPVESYNTEKVVGNNSRQPTGVTSQVKSANQYEIMNKLLNNKSNDASQ